MGEIRGKMGVTRPSKARLGHFTLRHTHCVSYLLVFVDDCVEELAVSPAGGEVVTAEAWVALHHALGPQQQLLLGRHVI